MADSSGVLAAAFRGLERPPRASAPRVRGEVDLAEQALVWIAGFVAGAAEDDSGASTVTVVATRVHGGAVVLSGGQPKGFAVRGDALKLRIPAERRVVTHVVRHRLAPALFADLKLGDYIEIMCGHETQNGCPPDGLFWRAQSERHHYLEFLRRYEPMSMKTVKIASMIVS